MDRGSRIEHVKEQLMDAGKDALIVTGPENSFYFSGFHAVSDGNYPVTVIPAEGDPRLFVSALDKDAAAYDATIEVVIPEDGYIEGIVDQLSADADAFITGNTSIGFYDRIADNITLTVNDDIVSGLRRIKSETEIEHIRNAYQLTEQVLTTVTEQIVGEKRVTEDEDAPAESTVAAEIEYEMRKRGAHGPAFPTIVATGASSSMPHHTSSETVIEEGPLLFDIGANVNRYCSDISRTYHIGQPSDPFKTVYELVRKAQERAADALAPSVAASEVDEAARSVLDDAGYGDRFTHSTGHGVGIDVHEQPNLSARSDAELAEGMVVTVEPGVYLKGDFGVRIEDAYVITEDGSERLSTLSRSLEDMVLTD